MSHGPADAVLPANPEPELHDGSKDSVHEDMEESDKEMDDPEIEPEDVS